MISSLKSKFQHRGGAFICFLVSVLLYGRLYGTIEVAALYLPCVLFLFHWCCSSILKVLFPPVWSLYVVTIEVCRVEVYSVLFAVCAFYPVCDMWCCLLPYNAI